MELLINLINQINLSVVDANLIIGGIAVVLFGKAFKTVWDTLSNK